MRARNGALWLKAVPQNQGQDDYSLEEAGKTMYRVIAVGKHGFRMRSLESRSIGSSSILRILYFLLQAIVVLLVVLLSVYVALGSYYWLGWPDYFRLGIAFLAVPVLVGLWFFPGPRRMARRAASAGLMLVFFTAYFTKSPIPQDWVPLHQKEAVIDFNGGEATIANFRDAIHKVGEASEPRWETTSFDLDTLEGAQLILQPFGPSAATVHVMTTFHFADGRHLAISVEARRTSWTHFDMLSGFFRHDEVYIVLGTERDLLWKRLARNPPNELYFYDLTRSTDEIRAYLETLLGFVDKIHETPEFYSTATESCFTTLIKLVPRIENAIPWYDPGRWLPGASIRMFQQLDIIDNTVSAEELAKRGKLQPDIKSPRDFPTDADWSRYLRQHTGQQ